MIHIRKPGELGVLPIAQWDERLVEATLWFNETTFRKLESRIEVQIWLEMNSIESDGLIERD